MMLRHNLKLAIRNFQREKSTFLINLIGLSTGIACTLLIAVWVMDELKYDTFHENKEQLYQVMQRIPVNENDVLTWTWTPGILATMLKSEMPEVELAAHVTNLETKGLISKDKLRFEGLEKYVSDDFFDLFSFKLLDGDRNKLLQDNKSVILTKDLAFKIFNRTDNLIGETIEWERKYRDVGGEFTITGIIESPPVHSTMEFDLLFSYDFYLEKNPEFLEWKNSDPATFITLKEGIDISIFNKKIETLIQDRVEGAKETLFLRKFSDRYLYNKYENGIQAGGRILYVKLFSIIALFILVIACINFMNLSTAKATRRLKEVGVKKAVGADRGSLIAQYLSESLLITFIALLLAISIATAALPYFNEITDKSLTFEWTPSLVIAGIAITLFAGLIAGSYPALYLSSFEPASIFKGNWNSSFGELWARKGLVVFQFTLSIILIVAVTVVYKQIQFIQAKHLGYEKDNVVVLKKLGNLEKDLGTFLNEVKNISGVVNASTIDGDMSGYYGYTTGLTWDGHDQERNPIRFGTMIVGEEIIETLGMELIAGKDFSESNDKGAYIFNEAAIKVMGLKDPIGKTVKRRGDDHRIIGVVKNFHFESLYEKVKPCYLRLGNFGDNILIKIKAGSEQQTIAQLEEYHSTFNPGLPFDFKFLDDDYQKLYAAEARVSSLARYFAGMAILISCLGLFGLAAYTAQRRRKEIGIRKVLGASVLNITRMLSSDFTQMVITAICIALPVSYFMAKYWLESFAFRIDLQVWFFIAAGLMALVIAWLTVVLQTIRAARINPVYCLKED